MYTLPEASSATPNGYFNMADVAWILSELKPAVPVPAIVVMIPVETVTLRMQLLLASAMYTLPKESRVLIRGRTRND